MVHFDFRKLDVFSFGEEQKCLVGSVDLLYRNSWNEVRTLHFNGEQAMIEALKTILGKMHQDAAPPDSVEVFCYSQHLRGLIRTRVQQTGLRVYRTASLQYPPGYRALQSAARLRPDVGAVLRAA